ncbi:AAA family ATPase [Paralimibaculum aggregatum]|uniref:AAA family ATPase n=1 Tax=Paralimibaculum aggregatum TaxID=3036245 RepID=A0ABQ6LLR8_9RHOB|nr:AAA family ATPase [Limibaculum sp. NKW23]GMG83259.1 AAA family ATPase [Limibaculum sp. NKW23]
MYEAFYELKHRPFLMTADPDFLYWSNTHTLAFTMLRYGVTSRAPLTVITGEIGSGKTTLLRHLMNELPEDVVVGLVSNMQEGRGDLLHWVMMSFDQSFEDVSYVRNFQRFQEFLIENYAEGKRSILIVDEAQNMSPASLEELRMLSNINADKDELLQIILVGQPQLRDLLRRPELVQVVQRIAADFHIEALGAEDVYDYIQRRLEIAGARWQIFPRRTCELIHEATGGIPRLVNSLCDLCLVYGFSDDQKTITEEVLRDFLAGVEKHGIFDKFKPLGRSPVLVSQSH